MSILGFGIGVGRMYKAATASPAPPDFPSTGLVAAWSFDDTLTDSVGSKVLTASGGDSYVAGKLGTKALQLTATNSVSVTTDDFNYIANPFTVSMWTKRAADGVPFWWYDSGGDRSFYVAVNATDVVLLGDTAGGPFPVTDTVTIADDTWALVTIRFSAAAGLTVNVDGRTAVNEPAVTSVGDYTGGSLRIGSDTATCTFDALYIWNVCLTDQQVSDLYNGGSGLTP